MTRRLGGTKKGLAAVASLSLAVTLAWAGAMTGCGSSSSQTGPGDTGTEGSSGSSGGSEDAGNPDTYVAFDAYVADTYIAPDTYLATLAPPTFMPASGATFNGPTNVTIVPPAGFPAAGFIYYTTNGTNPNQNSLVYSGPIQVSQSETIRAYASAPGMADSPIVFATYTVMAIVSDSGMEGGGTLPAPAFTPTSQTQSNDFKVAVSAASGATICYTLDGVTTPTCNSSGACTGSSLQYNSVSQVAINGSVTNPSTGTATLQAIACAAGSTASSVSSQQYTLKVATPSFSNPAPGTITLGSTPIVSSTTTGATIGYTTTSTVPTCINGTVGVGTGVTDPHTFANGANTSNDGLTKSTTFQLIGCKAGYAPSAAGTAAFTLQLNPLAFPGYAAPTSGGPYGPVAGTGAGNWAAPGPGAYDNYVSSIRFVDTANDVGSYALSNTVTEWACYTLDGTAPACGTTAPTNTGVAGACSANVPTGGCPGGTTASQGCGVILSPYSNASNDNGSGNGTITKSGAAVNIIDCATGFASSSVVMGTYTLQLDPPDINLPGVQGEANGCTGTGANAVYGAQIPSYSIPSSDVGNFFPTIEQDGPGYSYAYVCVANGSTPACGNGSCTTGIQYGTGDDFTQCDENGPQLPPTAGSVKAGDSWSIIGCPGQTAATGVGFLPSAVTTVSFTGPGVASAPSIAPTSGAFTNPVAPSITNTDTTSGGTEICYTEDGTTPTCTTGSCGNATTGTTYSQSLSAAGSAYVTEIDVSAGGSGYITAPNVNLSGGGATTQATATSTLSISGFNITTAGSGYTTPQICIPVQDNIGSGEGAYVDLILSSSGSVASIVFDSAGFCDCYWLCNGADTNGGHGDGYISPWIDLTSYASPDMAGGTQAVATVTGSVDSVNITSGNGAPFNDYTTPPAVAFTGGSGSNAAATALTSNGFKATSLSSNTAGTLIVTACNATETQVPPITDTYTFSLSEPDVTSVGGTTGNLNTASTVPSGNTICVTTASNFTGSDGSSQIHVTYGATPVTCASTLPSGASTVTTTGQACPQGAVAVTVPNATTFTLNAIACGTTTATQTSSAVRSVAFESVTTAPPVITTDQVVAIAGINGCQPGNTGKQPAGDNCTPQSPWYNTFNVYLQSPTTSATLCYSTNGTPPSCVAASGTCNSGLMYSGPVPITVSGTPFQAIACNVITGASTATPVTTFTLDVSPLSAYPPGSCGNGIDIGFYDGTNGNTTVSNAVAAQGGATVGAVICFTTDGSAPGCTNGSGSNSSTICAPGCADPGTGDYTAECPTNYSLSGASPVSNANAVNPTASSTAFTGPISTSFTLNWQACNAGFQPATGGQMVSPAPYRHVGAITLDGALGDWNTDAEENGNGYFTYDANNFYFAVAGLYKNASAKVVTYLGVPGPSAAGATSRPPNLIPTGTTPTSFAATEGVVYAIEWLTSPGTAAPVLYSWSAGGGWVATAITVSYGSNVANAAGPYNLEMSIPIASLPLLGTPPGALHVSENEYYDLASSPAYYEFFGAFGAPYDSAANYGSCLDPNGN